MNAEPEDPASPDREVETSRRNGRTSASRVGKSDKGSSKNGHAPKRDRITVEGEGVEAASDVLPLAVPELGPGRQLVVPSSAELQVALAQANTLEELIHFEKMVAVMKAAGEQFRLAIDEAIRIASFDLVTRRKIGGILLQVDRRGGDRAKRQRASLLEKQLQELGKDKVKRCRAIARIEATRFTEYLELLTRRHEIPTEAGVMRHARRTQASEGQPAKQRNGRRRRNPGSLCPALQPPVLESVRRVLGEIDVCIGDADVKCKLRLKPETAHLRQLRGAVFVAECLDPAEWLPKLARLRRNTGLDAVLVALPAETSAEWFKRLMDGEDDWACCFPTGVLPPLMLAYLGHTEGFKATCAELGAVLRPF